MSNINGKSGTHAGNYLAGKMQEAEHDACRLSGITGRMVAKSKDGGVLTPGCEATLRDLHHTLRKLIENASAILGHINHLTAFHSAKDRRAVDKARVIDGFEDELPVVALGPGGDFRYGINGEPLAPDFGSTIESICAREAARVRALDVATRPQTQMQREAQAVYKNGEDLKRLRELDGQDGYAKAEDDYRAGLDISKERLAGLTKELGMSPKGAA